VKIDAIPDLPHLGLALFTFAVVVVVGGALLGLITKTTRARMTDHQRFGLALIAFPVAIVVCGVLLGLILSWIAPIHPPWP
jgi:uncharacterized membrane protein (DUF106 family)